MQEEVIYQLGIPEPLRGQAVDLYDNAFGAKFALAIPDIDKRRNLLADALVLDFAFAAIQNDQLVGLAGFQNEQGSLTKGINLERLLQHLGWLGGLRAMLVFSLYEREPETGELLMDGIAVNQAWRGQGIGGALLTNLKKYASEQGFENIRLDVIDTNSDAKRLYERQGFVAVHTEDFGFLREWLGFGSATRMRFALSRETP